ELGLERGIVTCFEVRVLELFYGCHKDLGHVAPAVGSEMAAGIGLGGHRRPPEECPEESGHGRLKACATLRKACILRWSLMPGADSMREQASTPQGCASAMARATFSESSPPAMMMRSPEAAASD